MKTKVLFYYPQHFNRGKGENLYFKPFIEVCKKHSLSYLLVEEPDKSTKAPRNKAAYKFDVFFFIISVLRKLLPLNLFPSFEQREQLIGKCINILSLGKFKASVYVTLSNPLGGVLRGINPRARIFDYQHGIIPTMQPGYFNTTKATDLMRLNQKEVLVYGEGFKNSFLKVDANYYADKVFVIGKPSSTTNQIKNQKNILVPLQLIESENMPEEWFSDQVDLLAEQFQALEEGDALRQRKIYLKHHPRSSRTYDISRLLQFSFVELYDESVPQDFCLHVTFFSTTAFDYAAYGIPSLFLYSKHIPQGKTVYIDEFEYPYPHINSIRDWLVYLNNSLKKAEVKHGILEWHQKFYSPFNESLFLKLIDESTKN